MTGRMLERLDGTKVKANASKRKAMSYGRMGETEARLKTEFAELLRQAEAQDAAEDGQYGVERLGDVSPSITPIAGSTIIPIGATSRSRCERVDAPQWAVDGVYRRVTRLGPVLFAGAASPAVGMRFVSQ